MGTGRSDVKMIAVVGDNGDGWLLMKEAFGALMREFVGMRIRTS